LITNFSSLNNTPIFHAIVTCAFAIAAQYPGKKIVTVSARDEINLDAWFESRR